MNRYQIIHTSFGNILKLVCDKLLETFSDRFLIEKELSEIIDLLHLNYQSHLSGDNFLTAFTLVTDFEEIGETQKSDFFEHFHDLIREEEKCIRLTKFNDQWRLQDYTHLYEEIGAIEMDLREVLTYIFAQKYSPEYENLVDEYKVRLASAGKNKQQVERKLENDFFYLLFSDYVKLDEPVKPKLKEVLTAIESENNYELFKEKLYSKGIIKESHTDFLERIKQDVSPIEDIRNCVAHYREISSTKMANYEKARVQLEESIEQFWIEEFRTEDEDLWQWEDEALERVTNLLERAIWDYENGEVIFRADEHTHIDSSFTNYQDMFAFLEEEALNHGSAHLPFDKEFREEVQNKFFPDEFVEKALQNYQKELLIFEE